MRNEVLYPRIGMRTFGWVMCTKEGLSGLKIIIRTPKNPFKHWRMWKTKGATEVWTCLQCA
jgi:hypothetical protein